MSRIETLKLKPDKIPKTTVNAEVIKDNSNKTVLKPMNCDRILSISISDDKRCKLLLDNRDIIESNIEEREPWKWRYEVHMFPTEDNTVRVRGSHNYQHFLLRNQSSLKVEINGVQIESTTQDRKFELDIKENNDGFEGWTVITDLYKTNESSNSCVVVGFSREIKNFSVISDDMTY